ncbi:MAG: hypothetical protein RIG68_22240 [Imperialibacter sp.]|uniref:hypothetical protein n=1 Tax=Imperialibacter sp. TaxID=2038411 RepID=UPI0032EF23F6
MDSLKERKQMSWQGWFYAIQRIDLLIISICGAGIYVILETLKFSKTNPLESLTLIKGAGALFVLSIVVNFISQFTGKSANEMDMKMCQAKLDAGQKPNKKQAKEITKCDDLADIYTKWTNALNLISMITMLVALISLILYFLFSF